MLDNLSWEALVNPSQIAQYFVCSGFEASKMIVPYGSIIQNQIPALASGSVGERVTALFIQLGDLRGKCPQAAQNGFH